MSTTSFETAKDLRDALLTDYRLTPQELDTVLQQLKEGQHLDYKDGKITHKDQRVGGRKTVREYVNGFANADGGVLVVGVSDKPREVSACRSPGKQTLDRWAESLLLDMAPLLVPPPRFQVVNHSKGQVLLIAVARAPQLIMEPESGRYFLRFHESTKPFPEHLLTDLLLGRRQQPILDLVDVRPAAPEANIRPDSDRIRVDFYLTLENVGLVLAEDVEIGMVAWSFLEGPPLNRHLLSHLEARNTVGSGWKLLHVVATPRGNGPLRLPPFSRNSSAIVAERYQIFLQRPHALKLSVAVYVVAKSAAPIWFQVDLTCWRSPHNVSPGDIFEDVRVVRVIGRRPEVAVTYA